MFLTIILIILAYFVVYIPVGVLCAKNDLPRSIAANTLQKGTRYWDAWENRNTVALETQVDRPAVRVQMGLMVLFWPFLFPQRKFFASIESYVDKVDPKAIAERENAAAEREREQQRRNAILERENDELERRNNLLRESRMEFPEIKGLAS